MAFLTLPFHLQHDLRTSNRNSLPVWSTDVFLPAPSDEQEATAKNGYRRNAQLSW
jgi:hypothetical protein